MVSTRSGQGTKAEENTKKAIPGEVNDVKGPKTSSSRSRESSAKRGIDKGVEVCSSAVVNSPCLGGANGGAPTNTDSVLDIKATSSQGLDELVPSIALEKKILVQMEKITPSPLRRSGRIGKRFCPDSSSKTSTDCVEKDEVEVVKKELAVETEDQKRNVRHDSFCSKKRKRLDARGYLSSMKPLKKKATLSEIPQRSFKVNDASKGAAIALGGKGSNDGSKNGTSIPEACSDAASSSSTERIKFIESSSIHHKEGADNDTQAQEACSHNTSMIKNVLSTIISKEYEVEETQIRKEEERLSTQRGEIDVRDIVGVAEDMDSTVLKKFQLKFQTELVHDVCIICKCSGMLLRCSGKDCKRRYHLSCVEPPLRNVPPGMWHCICCMRKKIESGIYSVCEGMESVWDTRVIELSDCSGMKKERQYLVKYIGLAHVHNRWVSEDQLLLEAPNLLVEFNKRSENEKAMLWKSDWTVPQCLLLRRLVMPPHLADECFSGSDSGFSHCYYEWFVKWTGLGYEHATWEFENSSFLTSIEAKGLIENYETRHEEQGCGSSSPIVQSSQPFNNVPSVELEKPASDGDHGVACGHQLNFSHPDIDSAPAITDLIALVNPEENTTCDRATRGEALNSVQLRYVSAVQEAQPLCTVREENLTTSGLVGSLQVLSPSKRHFLPMVHSASAVPPDVILSDGMETKQAHSSSRAIQGPHQSPESEFYVEHRSDGVEFGQVPSTTQTAAASRLQPVDDVSSLEPDWSAILGKVRSEPLPCPVPNITTTVQSNDVVPYVEMERSMEFDGIGRGQPSCSSQRMEISMIQLTDATPATSHDMADISDAGNRVLDNSQLNVNPATDTVLSIDNEWPVTADVERTEEQNSSQLNLIPLLRPDNAIQSEDPVLVQFLPPTAFFSSEHGQTSASTALQNEGVNCSELCHEVVGTQGEGQTDVLTERTDDLRYTGNLDEPGTHSTQPFFITAQLPSQGLLPDPLQNEILRIHKEGDSVDLKFEDEKLQLAGEYKTELDVLATKYDMLLKDVEATFLNKKRTLEMIYDKVYINHILAREFRIFSSRFYDNKAAAAKAPNLQGGNMLSTAQLQVSQPLLSSVTPTPTAASNISIIPVHILTPTLTFRPVGSTFSTSIPTSTSVQPAQVVHSSRSNPGRPNISAMLPPNGSHQVGSGFHSPAPRIHSSRPPVCMPLPNHPLESGGRPVWLQPPISHSQTFRPVLLRVPPMSRLQQSGDASHRTQQPGSSRPLP